MLPVLPVTNGILPRPDGGRITGVFEMLEDSNLFADVGVGHEIFICPWVEEEEDIYPVGVVARIMDYWEQPLENQGKTVTLLIGVLEGRGHARWSGLRQCGPYLVADECTWIRLKNMRSEYPAISGAGWLPEGGYTEFRSAADIPVTIYGHELEKGSKVSITANLGGLVEKEHAHTLEHAIIRALHTNGLCTARTLIAAMRRESAELKQSVEKSFHLVMPEYLGVTDSGVCGNPMTNLAHFYLAQEMIDGLKAGKSFAESITTARRRTMSQLTQDIGLTTQSGLRVLQGLKKGMSHNDMPLKVDTVKKVIKRFPFEPWS